MKKIFFIVLILNFTVLFSEELMMPSEAIVKTYQQHEGKNFFSKNIVLLSGDDITITLLEENKIVNDEIMQLYKTVIKNKDLHSLNAIEKRMLIGYLLTKMDEYKILSNKCTFIDNNTACEKAEDSSCYICHTRIKKSELRK